MIRPLLIILALLLAGCQSLSSARPPICDGMNRRPANPTGSLSWIDPAAALDGARR